MKKRIEVLKKGVTKKEVGMAICCKTGNPNVKA